MTLTEGILALVMLPLGWLWRRQNAMTAQLNDTYSKEGTEKLIDLKQKPMQESLDRNTRATEEMTKLLTEVRIELARTRSHGEEKSGS